MRGVRRTARASDARTRVLRLLAVDPAADAATLRPLRRSAANVACDQPPARGVRPVPPRTSDRDPRAGDRIARRRLARHRSRLEVRGASIARAAAGDADATARRRRAGGRHMRRAGPSARVTPPAARIQPGVGSRALPSPARRAGASPDAADRDANRSARGATAPQRARCIHGVTCGAPPVTPARSHCRAGGRCEYHGRNARGMRAGVEGCRGGGSARAYGGPSRDATTLTISVATASFVCSPSITTQECSAACRR